VSGTWAFASGCRHATWLGAQCPIFEADGTQRVDQNGKPVLRTMLVPVSEVQWKDIWHVVGLRGTASDEFSLTDHFVRHDHSITREFEKERREAGPLYRMSALTCYELGFAGVALGIARAALDSFVDLARNKIPRGMKSPIRDNAVVQMNAAQAEVRVRSARAFLLQTVTQIWEDLTQPDGALSLEHRMTLRMASTHAIHTAREAVDFAYNAAGTTAIFESHPLERRFRDMHTVTQQLQGRLSHFETVGAYLLGGEPDLTFV
jgi:alkylation response protein AidB-like acyl-CoA dehydrogenase